MLRNLQVPLQERHAAVVTSLFKVAAIERRNFSASLTRRASAIELSAATKRAVAAALRAPWRMGPRFEFG